MSLNILLDYDKLFFNIFKKSTSMKNKIMNLFCRSSKREATREDENKLYLIGTISVRNQTISRTLCVEPPPDPPWTPLGSPWTPPGSPCRLHSGGGGTCRHSDAQVRE